MKKYLVLVLGLILVLSICCFACAEEDYSYLNPNCPFEIRNGIRFGMTVDAVNTLENNQLQEDIAISTYDEMYDTTWSTEVALGGLDGYELNYHFKNDSLVAIEYFFKYPKAYSQKNYREYSMNDIFNLQSYLDSISLVCEAVEKKYGPMTTDMSNETEYQYIWKITYDNCMCGVKIEVAVEANSKGGLWCNRVTYTPYDYQKVLDRIEENRQKQINEYEEKQRNIEDTFDSI